MEMDFEYYRNMIKNSETESSPLADFEMQGFHERSISIAVKEGILDSFLRLVSIR